MIIPMSWLGVTSISSFILGALTLNLHDTRYYDGFVYCRLISSIILKIATFPVAYAYANEVSLRNLMMTESDPKADTQQDRNLNTASVTDQKIIQPKPVESIFLDVLATATV
jgi:hypothetical protein